MTTFTIHTTPATAKTVLQTGDRTITTSFRAPSRTALVNVPDTAWRNLLSVPEAYRGLLDAVLDTAAKRIISNYLKAFTVWPSTIPAALLTADAILSDASGANTEWLSKEDLELAWRASATRTAWTTSPNYQANQAFRKAVAHYEGLIMKLAGKTSYYTPTDLDLLIAKMKPEDLETELGAFMLRRVEALSNKPAAAAIDTDLL